MDLCLTGQRLPSEHHVGLHCRPKVFAGRDADGNVADLNHDAFRVDPDGISVNWLEFEGTHPDEQFAIMCDCMSGGRDVKKSDYVALLLVADIEATESMAGVHPYVVHDPINGPRPNLGHSLIKSVDPDDELQRQELASKVKAIPVVPEVLQKIK